MTGVCGRMKKMMVAVVFVVCGGSLTLPHAALGQELPCPEYDRDHPDCCPCLALSLVCQATCPPRHYATAAVGNNTCVSPGDLDSSPSSANSTTPAPLVRCFRCHATCKSCSGARPEDCVTCADELTFKEVNRTMTCAPHKTDSSDNVGAIVGGTIAVLMVVVVVVLLLVWVYRYRRWRSMEPEQRRSISTLMGPRGKAGSSVDSTAGPQSAESVEGATIEEKSANRVRSHKESVYVNVDTTVPKAEAIRQSHDKVMRYTRDPTIKAGQGQSKPSQNTGTGLPEDEELKHLPLAPAVPGKTTQRAPPKDTYEIVETPAPKPSLQPKPKPQPKPSPGAPAPPAQSYEIMDFPISSAAGQSAKTRITLLTTGTGDKQKRRTTMETSTASSLPNPKASSSCPALPRFPCEEEHPDKQGLRQESQSRLKTPTASAHALHEEPAEDYVNVGAKKKDVDTAQQEVSDPEEDYENTGPKKNLVPQASDKSGGSGLVNPALEVLEEPQPVYGNQDTVDDEDRSRYSNTPLTPPQGKAGAEDSNQTADKKGNGDVTDQPTYGNDVSDDEEEEDGGDYQNCPRPQSKP